LSSEEAAIIKLAVKNVVFDQLLNWKIGNYDVVSNFTFSSNSSSLINFQNNSLFASTYTWDFGDGNSSNEVNPTHNYASEGEFTVRLTASKCGNFISSQQTITISNLSNSPEINETIECIIFPNPTKEYVTITSNTIIDAISIYDVNGRLIDYIEVKSAQKRLDLSTKKEGFYFLKINSNGKTCTKKLIKN
jgi:hypothetical protein